MDPNAALLRIRDLIEEINSGKFPDNALPILHAELSSEMTALDKSLVLGGALPTSWQ